MSEATALERYGLRRVRRGAAGRFRPAHGPTCASPRACSPTRELLEQIAGDRSLEQLQNVATLPGIVEAALAMPDIHQGYGFPVGGVAATEPPDGVISPAASATTSTAACACSRCR